MYRDEAIAALAALAQGTRLDAFRLLVQAGPEGLAAGELAERLGTSPPALSFHLKGLTHAGLARARQDGRFVIYSADFDAMQSLLDFLTENCCGGASCAPASRKATRNTVRRKA
jgi:DNA-binding transcriptional ArsR family regulator